MPSETETKNENVEEECKRIDTLGKSRDSLSFLQAMGSDSKSITDLSESSLYVDIVTGERNGASYNGSSEALEASSSEGESGVSLDLESTLHNNQEDTDKAGVAQGSTDEEKKKTSKSSEKKKIKRSKSGGKKKKNKSKKSQGAPSQQPKEKPKPLMDLRHILKKYEKKVEKVPMQEQKVNFHGSMSSIPFLKPKKLVDDKKKKAVTQSPNSDELASNDSKRVLTISEHIGVKTIAANKGAEESGEKAGEPGGERKSISIVGADGKEKKIEFTIHKDYNDEQLKLWKSLSALDSYDFMEDAGMPTGRKKMAPMIECKDKNLKIIRCDSFYGLNPVREMENTKRLMLFSIITKKNMAVSAYYILIQSFLVKAERSSKR